MEDKKYEKILEGIKQIEINQAVTNEKISNMNVHVKSTNKRLDGANDAYEKLEKRVDIHDKVVGAVTLTFGILIALLKFKVL